MTEPAEQSAAPWPIGQGAMIAITGVTVIDATGGSPLLQMTVVIDGDRIAEIRSTAAPETLDGMRVVDGAGKFLIPGLWDAHVHTFVSRWQPDHHLPLFIANGVTGIRDLGGAFPISAIDEIRAAIASGARVGPRIVAGVMLDGPAPVWPVARPVATPEEGRQAVATIATEGADFLKVYTLLPREAFFTIADTANERGIPFAGHVPIAVTAAEASAAGQRSIEHFSDSMLPYCSTDEDQVLADLRAAAAGPDPVPAYAAAFLAALPRLLSTFDPAKVEDLANRFVANQTWFTPTLNVVQIAAAVGARSLTADPRLRYMPPEVVASWNPQANVGTPVPAPEGRTVLEQLMDVGAAMTRTMQRVGAPLLTGTDVGLPYLYPGFSLHDELALVVEAGLTPLEALQAATRNTAQCLGLDADLGTVEIGKLADLVLLDADPLADITNTTRISAVVANGRLFERNELHGLLQAAEEAAATPVISPPS